MRKILFGVLLAVSVSAGAIVSGLVVHDHSTLAKGGGTLSPLFGPTATGPVAITLAKATPAVACAGAGASTLATYTIPANTLTVNGKSVRVVAYYTGLNNANAKILRVNLNATIGLSMSLSTATARYARCEAVITRTGLNAQVMNWVCNDGQRTSGAAHQTNGDSIAFTETETNAIAINIGVNCVTAAGDITLQDYHVEGIN